MHNSKHNKPTANSSKQNLCNILSYSIAFQFYCRVKTECDDTRRNQIRSSSKTDKSIYIGGGVSSVEYWLSWSAGRQRTIVVTLDGLFRVKLKTAGYPLHSLLSSTLLLPCVAMCHQILLPLYLLLLLSHLIFMKNLFLKKI